MSTDPVSVTKVEDAQTESAAMAETPNPLVALLAPLGSFLGRFGLATLIALAFVWQAYTERTDGQVATAAQLKDLRGEMRQFAGLLETHGRDSQAQGVEVTRILLAMCLNGTKSDVDRDRCLGLRR